VLSVKSVGKFSSSFFYLPLISQITRIISIFLCYPCNPWENFPLVFLSPTDFTDYTDYFDFSVLSVKSVGKFSPKIVPVQRSLFKLPAKQEPSRTTDSLSSAGTNSVLPPGKNPVLKVFWADYGLFPAA